MRILIVGSGGREHAITWRLANDEEKHELYCVPGNAGTAAIATNIALQTGNDLDVAINGDGFFAVTFGCIGVLPRRSLPFHPAIKILLPFC